MLLRRMFIAYGDLKNKLINHTTDLIHMFKFENMYFMYVETTNPSFSPDIYFYDGLIPFPNGELWMPMPSIFCASKPKSAEHWKRRENHKPILRVNKVKCDMVASYIFEHYRMQEEAWPHPREKYDNIFILGNLLAFYTEGLEEREIDSEPPMPLLTTRATPWEAWGDIMEQKFEQIEGFSSYWIQAQSVEIYSEGNI